MLAPEPIPELLKSANDSSARGFAVWVTFLTVGLYLTITAGTTTQKLLLLGQPVKLPLLSVDVSLLAFYFFAPVLFFGLHFYVLTQFYLLAQTLRMLTDEIGVASILESDRRRLRAQMDTFLQMLMGMSEKRLIRGLLPGSLLGRQQGARGHVGLRLTAGARS